MDDGYFYVGCARAICQPTDVGVAIFLTISYGNNRRVRCTFYHHLGTNHWRFDIREINMRLGHLTPEERGEAYRAIELAVRAAPHALLPNEPELWHIVQRYFRPYHPPTRSAGGESLNCANCGLLGATLECTGCGMRAYCSEQCGQHYWQRLHHRECQQ